eukprot:6483199-Amphidinium_carterae.1
MATTKGILQGDPLSTCLFVLTYQVAIDMALERVFHDSEHHYDQFLQLPVPIGRDLTAVHNREVEVLTHITYADDLVFPVISDTPEQLLKTTVAIVKHLQDAFSDFGLDVNTNKEKSEILLRITGKASKGIYQFLHQCDHMNVPLDDDQLDLHLAKELAAANLRDTSGNDDHDHDHDHDTQPHGATTTPPTTDNKLTMHFVLHKSIAITNSYIYLGKHTTANLNQKKEIQV